MDLPLRWFIATGSLLKSTRNTGRADKWINCCSISMPPVVFPLEQPKQIVSLWVSCFTKAFISRQVAQNLRASSKTSFTSGLGWNPFMAFVTTFCIWFMRLIDWAGEVPHRKSPVSKYHSCPSSRHRNGHACMQHLVIRSWISTCKMPTVNPPPIKRKIKPWAIE